MKVRVFVAACAVVVLWLGQCSAGPLDYFDFYEQRVDVAPILGCQIPGQFPDLSAFDPVIEGIRPLPEDPARSLTKGSLLDLDERNYGDGKNYLIEIRLRLYTSADRAKKDFHRWASTGRKNRFDKKVDNGGCKAFISGVHATRGDMVPTRTGSSSSSVAFLCNNLIIHISEYSQSQHGEYKNIFIRELGRQMGKVPKRE